jgi:hypothetical protein
VAHGARGRRKEHPHIGCTVKLDPDTGESKIDPDSGKVSESAGFEIYEVEPSSISILKWFTYEHDKKKVLVEIARQYPNHLKVEITSHEKDGSELCRKLMDSIDSKLRLAAKLKDAKEKKRREEMHQKPAQRNSEKK